MKEDARIALLQEILAGLIERGRIAPLPTGVRDDAPLRLTLLPAAARPPTVIGSPSRIKKPSK